MAAPMTASQTRAQMKKWLGPRFKEFSGWTTRKRPGTFAPVGLVIHHTGSDSGQNSTNYDTFLFVTGRPEDGIPGPLCQATCEMDGDVIVGAIGRANHAGSGSASTLKVVQGDRASRTAEIKPGPDGTNGNGWFYGLEVKFDGGQPMTAKQYDAAVRWAAAICDFYKWTAGSIVGHKEWTARKNDPGSTFMAKFRRDVDARLKAGPQLTPTTPPPVVKPPASTPPPMPQEADMATYTPDQIRALAGQGVHGQKIGRSDVTIGMALESLYKDVNEAERISLLRYQRMEAIHNETMAEVKKVESKLDALLAALAAHDNPTA